MAGLSRAEMALSHFGRIDRFLFGLINLTELSSTLVHLSHPSMGSSVFWSRPVGDLLSGKAYG
jgi:hypothetical protein